MVKKDFQMELPHNVGVEFLQVTANIEIFCAVALENSENVVCEIKITLTTLVLFRCFRVVFLSNVYPYSRIHVLLIHEDPILSCL